VHVSVLLYRLRTRQIAQRPFQSFDCIQTLTASPPSGQVTLLLLRDFHSLDSLLLLLLLLQLLLPLRARNSCSSSCVSADNSKHPLHLRRRQQPRPAQQPLMSSSQNSKNTTAICDRKYVDSPTVTPRIS
jgi:hypothetical protein